MWIRCPFIYCEIYLWIFQWSLYQKFKIRESKFSYKGKRRTAFLVWSSPQCNRHQEKKNISRFCSKIFIHYDYDIFIYTKLFYKFLKSQHLRKKGIEYWLKLEYMQTSPCISNQVQDFKFLTLDSQIAINFLTKKWEFLSDQRTLIHL